MRLTLRTLLAYRDGVLSSADSADLHQKIQKSQDAAKLLKRIEHISQDIQGSSPTIVGKGFEGDPNYLAEYLDDSLQGQNVPELERVCLESNVRLAELAACHRILATAMHTRVAVSDSLHDLAVAVGAPAERERIKSELQVRKQARLRSSEGKILRPHLSHSDGTSTGLTPIDDKRAGDSQSERSVDVQAPMVVSGGDTIQPKGLDLEGTRLSHEVPEYLVGRNAGSWRTPLTIVALVVLLSLLVWQALGPWERIMAMLTSETDTPGDRSERVQESPQEGVRPEKLRESGDADDRNAGSATEPSTGSDAANSPRPNTGEPEVTSRPAGEEVAKGSDVAQPEARPPSPDSSPPGDESDPELGAEPSTPAAPGSDSRGEASQPQLVPAGASVLLAPAADAGEPVVLSVSPVGQISRIASDSAIDPGTDLVVPPHFQPQLQLPTGVLWRVAGPSRLTVTEKGVETVLCRSMLSRTAQGGTVDLQAPHAKVILKLDDASSTIACEVGYRPANRGSILEAEVMQPVLVVVAAEGAVRVHLAGSNAEPIRLALGEGVGFVGSEDPQRFKLKNIPDWYRGTTTRPIDAEAAQLLADTLRATPNADGANLLAMCRSKRPESAAIAIQTMLLLRQWQTLLDSGFLNDPQQSIHWSRTLNLAQQMLLTDPSQTAMVQALFEAEGPGGQTDFRLFVGPTAQELSDDGLSTLVNSLDAKQLSTRVLAFYQLQRLTGKKLGFKPHVPNRASLQTWRRELATKQLAIQPVPDTLIEKVPN